MTPRTDGNGDAAALLEGKGARRGTVKVGVTASGAAHVSGLKRCGSIFGCSLCAPILREQRAALADGVMGRALEEGCRLVFVTATASHSRTDELAELWDGMQASWSFGFEGRRCARGNTFGYVGQIRAFDHTHGGNGWHPHVHAVLVFEPWTPWATVGRFLFGYTNDAGKRVEGVRDRYIASLGAWGMSAAADSRGFDVRKVSRTEGNAAKQVSRYLAKIDGGWGAGLELARSDLKSARRGGRTPFQLLEHASSGDHGWLAAGRLFREYEAASKNRRAVVVGQRLLERYGFEDAGEGAEQVEQAPDEGFVFEVEYTAAEWMRLLRAGYVPLVLEHVIDCALELSSGPAPPDG